jgi:pyruvate dehydrogenase E2 component (dihydrolipoamide acetyltransferase)
MAEVVMPRLSDSMEEGTILRWIKQDGDEVHRGDELVEIETDKATMTYEADQDGVLEIVAGEGQTLPIGEVIARISADGAAREQAGVTAADRGEERAEPVGAGADGDDGEVEPPSGPAPSPAPTAPAAAGPAAPAEPSADGGERVKASPVARRIARELGVDLRQLAGSGPGGRIVKADVEAAAGPARPAAAEAKPPAAAPAPSEVATAKGEVRVQELTRTQQLIARRMAESRATIPDFVLHAEIDMELAVEARQELKALAGDAPAPSLNDMVIKACALALREFPRVNGSYRDGHFELHSRVNVGVAVAAHDALIVPTVFDADRKPLGEIARETRELAAKVRDGAITPPELSGGTFTVSNLGMYEISRFTAVINPPQAAILAVGSVEPRAVVHGGELTARHTMAVTLSCDHRILYGADAAEFLARVRALLERPAGLAL